MELVGQEELWIGHLVGLVLGELVVLVRRIWLGLDSREKVVQHMCLHFFIISDLLFSMMLGSLIDFNGGLLCEAEITVLATYCVVVSDADWLPCDEDGFT